MTQLALRKAKADNGTELDYYVYPAEGRQFDRVLVYVHGLISDINWFDVPENLPPNTGICFLPRHPRTHVDHFELWTRNYELCLGDYRAHHEASYYHLLAQCYGTQPALHWVVTRPETFDTVTFAAPPIEMRNVFSLGKKLGILFGPSGGLVHSELTPRTYGRSPSLMQFIDENPTTVYEFTNSFYKQTNQLRKWLKKNKVPPVVPCQVILSTEDEVAHPKVPQLGPDPNSLPDRVSVIHSDHFCEKLPVKKEFWRNVFDFQKEHEGRFKVEGDIESILVTGGTGFLGSHIVRRLHANGKHVIIFARSVEKAKRMFSDLGERISVRQGSLDDLPSLDRALEGLDAVVHTAGHVSDWDTYANFEKTNVEGTKNILFVAHEKGLKQFIQISSLGVFGDTDQDNIDEDNRYSLSSDLYSNSKIFSEISVRRYCTINRIPFTIIRPGFIYGEGDNNFFPPLIAKLKANAVKFIGSRENIMNTVYVGNVAELVVSAIGEPKSFGETYNIADPQHTKIGDFFDDVSAGLGYDAPVKIVPKGVALFPAAILEGLFRTLRLKKAPPLTRKKVTFMARSRAINSSKAYALIGREPYSYQEGMKRTLASLKQP